MTAIETTAITNPVRRNLKGSTYTAVKPHPWPVHRLGWAVLVEFCRSFSPGSHDALPSNVGRFGNINHHPSNMFNLAKLQHSEALQLSRLRSVGPNLQLGEVQVDLPVGAGGHGKKDQWLDIIINHNNNHNNDDNHKNHSFQFFESHACPSSKDSVRSTPLKRTSMALDFSKVSIQAGLQPRKTLSQSANFQHLFQQNQQLQKAHHFSSSKKTAPESSCLSVCSTSTRTGRPSAFLWRRLCAAGAASAATAIGARGKGRGRPPRCCGPMARAGAVGRAGKARAMGLRWWVVSDLVKICWVMFC